MHLPLQMVRKRAGRLVFSAALALVAGAAAAGPAAVPVDASAVRIVWLEPEAGKAPEADVAAAGCERLARAFAPGSGPWGLGVFRAYGCYQDDARIGGKAVDDAWTIEVRRLRAGWSIRMLVDAAKLASKDDDAPAAPAKPLVVAELALPRSRQPAGPLADDAAAGVVAAALLGKLPFIARVRRADLEKGVLPAHPFPAAEALGRHRPDKLILLRLRLTVETGSWVPEIKGHAEYDESAGGWRLDKSALKALRKGPLFAHTALDEENPLGDLDSSWGAVQKTLARLARAALTGYRVELRYGWPLVHDALLLPKARLVNVLAESAQGVTAGLRGYLDYVARVSDSDTEGSYHFGWQRIAVGYAFTFSPGFIIDRIHVTPKFGEWALDMRLPATTDGEPPRDFSFSHKQSLGFDLDVESQIGSWFRARLWHARDMTLSLLGAGAAGATSQRYGLDLTVFGPQVTVGGWPFRPSGTLFAMYEGMMVQSGDPAVASQLNPAPLGSTGKREQAFFDLYYAGLGIGLVW